MHVAGGKTDEELMQAYQTGETEAFNELYARYSGRVYAYLANKVFDPSERQDLFQAIFLKLHKARHRYSPKYRFAPWLFTICRTSLVDYLRAKKPEASSDPARPEAISDSSPAEAIAAFPDAMADLPEKQKKALEMRYQDGLEFSEIAERLKTSSGNVRQLISRALRKLRGDQ